MADFPSSQSYANGATPAWDASGIRKEKFTGITSTGAVIFSALQNVGLTTTQLAALTTTQIGAMKSACLLSDVAMTALTTTAITALTAGVYADAAVALTLTQLKVLQTTQIAALTTTQIAALAAADIFGQIPAVAGTIQKPQQRIDNMLAVAPASGETVSVSIIPNKG